MKDTQFPTWDSQAAARKGGTGRYAPKLVRIDVYHNNNEIFAAGGYLTETGHLVRLPGNDDPMLAGTKVYAEPFRPGECGTAATALKTAVINDDCLRVARTMQEEGLNPAVLNLADANTAGGWYYRGASAQEESLCRASTLSRSLYSYYKKDRAETVGAPFFRSGYPLDLHFGGVYSPEVTVFREGDARWNRLLEEPFKVGVISVAALDFNEKHGKNLEYRASDGGFTPEGLVVIQDKIRTIYRIALANGHDSLVLGAFGCGAFRLRPDLVARLFHDLLGEDEFSGRFKDIRFAILERGKTSATGPKGKFAPFYELFA